MTFSLSFFLIRSWGMLRTDETFSRRCGVIYQQTGLIENHLVKIKRWLHRDERSACQKLIKMTNIDLNRFSCQQVDSIKVERARLILGSMCRHRTRSINGHHSMVKCPAYFILIVH